MARGDAVESERLVGSCPKLSYRMNDRAFVGRWTGAIGHNTARVHVLDWKLNKYGELLPEIMNRMERELAGNALTLWSGIAAFCAESIGVAAEKVLAATLQEGPGEEAVSRVEGLKDRAERLGLEPDEESLEEIRTSLAEAWRVVEERGG
jgi:hypothetical protein